MIIIKEMNASKMPIVIHEAQLFLFVAHLLKD